MSRSYTSRPSVTNTRGRGRGTQTRNPTGPMNNTDRNPGTGRGSTRTPQGASGRGNLGQTQQGSTQPIEQRMTHQGAYTMITPNEKKRQQIAEMAQQETAAYESHKVKNTQKQFNYVGTVGGGQMTQAGARRQTVQTSPTKTTKLLEQQNRKSFMKQKEEEELQKKKAAQRLKAQQNAEREKKETNNWDEQRRRTNEAFLRQLENKSKPSETGNLPDDSAMDDTGPAHNQSDTSSSVIGQSAGERTNQEREANLLANRGAVGGASGNSNSGNSASTDSIKHSDTDRNNGLTTEEQKRLNALAMIFPQIDESVLIDILQQVGFSVDTAITLLQG